MVVFVAFVLVAFVCMCFLIGFGLGIAFEGAG